MARIFASILDRFSVLGLRGRKRSTWLRKREMRAAELTGLSLNIGVFSDDSTSYGKAAVRDNASGWRSKLPVGRNIEGPNAIRARCIDPIERAHALNLRIAAAIANHFGAHG